jgi:two-component system KDP operon response regulator KdpE
MGRGAAAASRRILELSHAPQESQMSVPTTAGVPGRGPGAPALRPGGYVLVVDDDRPMLRVLSTGLRAYGFPVVTASDAGTALDLAARRAPEAILLDLRLPDLDGMEVLRSLRAWSTVPVLVVSGRSGVTARIEALDAGADDYVTKPFAIGELAARLRAVLRRPAFPAAAEHVVFGPYTVDLAACTITRTGTAVPADRTDGSGRTDGAGRPDAAGRADRGVSARDGDVPSDPADHGDVHLTPTEWRLLALLLRNPHRLVPGRELLAEVWGPDHVDRTNYLRVYVAGLRRKLEADPAHPRHLITEPGLGYRFQP